MIVLGADMHKSSHTLVAVAAITGELLGDKTAQVGARGFRELLECARALGRRSRPDALDGQLAARQPPARQV